MPQKQSNRPAKYSHINFKPSESISKAAERGLELRRKYGRGGTSVGVARAVQLKNRETISPSTAKRMYKFFIRHEKNRDSMTPSGEPGNGKIAWLLWGGDPGRSWANKLWKQMLAADKKESSQAEERYDVIKAFDPWHEVTEQDVQFARQMYSWILKGDSLAEESFRQGLNEDMQEITELYMLLSDDISDALKEWAYKYEIPLSTDEEDPNIQSDEPAEPESPYETILQKLKILEERLSSKSSK